MDISAEQVEGGITCIRLSGRMDIQGAQAVETRLAAHLAAKSERFVLDLAGVTFLASIGVRAILLSAKALRGRGGRLAIIDPVPEVAKVLSLTGVGELVPICEGMEAARDALAA
jgi:anti-anti-sigma factor